MFTIPNLDVSVEGWEGAYWEVVTNWNKYIPLNQRWKCSDAAYGGFLLHHVTRGTVQSHKTIQCITCLILRLCYCHSCLVFVTSHIFHIIKTWLHKNLYNKLEYKNSYIHHVFQIILLRIRFNKISL